jgi:hypothetical protein
MVPKLFCKAQNIDLCRDWQTTWFRMIVPDVEGAAVVVVGGLSGETRDWSPRLGPEVDDHI